MGSPISVLGSMSSLRGEDKESQLESLADFLRLAMYSGNKWQIPACSSLAIVKMMTNCKISLAGLTFRPKE